MKKEPQPSEKTIDTTTNTLLRDLRKNAKTLKTDFENAMLECRQKTEAYHQAFREGQPRIITIELRALAKISTLTMKIRKVEYKLAKTQHQLAKNEEKKKALTAEAKDEFLETIKGFKAKGKAAKSKQDKAKPSNDAAKAS